MTEDCKTLIMCLVGDHILLTHKAYNKKMDIVLKELYTWRDNMLDIFTEDTECGQYLRKDLGMQRKSFGKFQTP